LIGVLYPYFIDVTLTMSGEELILNDSYRAILKASNNGEVKAINDCEIDLGLVLHRTLLVLHQ